MISNITSNIQTSIHISISYHLYYIIPISISCHHPYHRTIIMSSSSKNQPAFTWSFSFRFCCSVALFPWPLWVKSSSPRCHIKSKSEFHDKISQNITKYDKQHVNDSRVNRNNTLTYFNFITSLYDFMIWTWRWKREKRTGKQNQEHKGGEQLQ